MAQAVTWLGETFDHAAFGGPEEPAWSFVRESGQGSHSLEAFLVSTGVVALAEIGDKTQLLAFVLAAKFRRPVPIILGIFAATLANHALAGAVGAWITSVIGPVALRWILGLSFIAMAIWTLIPDKPGEEAGATPRSRNAFITTLICFFIAEIGDKTQIATVALAAAFPNLVAVVSGTTCGMLIANIPVVFLGKAFADRLPMKAIHYGAAALFAVLGIMFLGRAMLH